MTDTEENFDKTKPYVNSNHAVLSGVICFGCGQGGADKEIEIMDMCQSCMGSGVGSTPDERCYECKGDGQSWNKVPVHSHCL